MSQEAAEKEDVPRDEGQSATAYEPDRPPTESSNMSGEVADNEGSSPEPSRERKPEENMAPGEQVAKGESQEGGVALGRTEEEGVAPSKSQEDTAEATVGTEEQETSAQEGGVALGRTEEEGVAPSKSQEDTAEATVGTEEQETSAQEGGVALGRTEEEGVAPSKSQEDTAEATVGTEEQETSAQEGGVALGRTEEEGVVPSKSQEDTAEATVGTEEQETSAQQTQVQESRQAALEQAEAGTELEGEEEATPITYDYEQLKSKPEMVNVSTDNMLQLFHSFGYECQKRSNLVVLAKDVVGFAAGNLVQLLDLSTLEQTCLRSLGGGGIGALAVHPSHSYFAVGEKGNQPVIAIYTYPELVLHRVLRGGTEQLYSHMDFSPGDGHLLASVGGNPDYMLTVWDWQKESIVLRSKAFSQDIYRVTFSPENPGQLTTSGTGHIRFWKMATTFTGLKLQGQLGKFGRTELSDITAYVELPDGKVLSGTEWGNLLLWDGGFIKVEISKKGKKFCHNGLIEVLFLDEGELISTGVDGYVRVWDFETIDNADIVEESNVFEMEPLLEVKVGNDVSLKSLARSVDPDTPTLWYAQDAGGGIWKTDIVVSHTRKAPEKLCSFHSGGIVGLACSPVAHQAASVAQDGSVRVYDLPSRQLLCHSRYSSGGSSLLWAPLSLDRSASSLVVGFQDGVLRVVRLEEGRSQLSLRQSHTLRYQLVLVHACKPHNKAVTSLAINSEGDILASGGRDNTVFFLSTEGQYEPIGFVRTPAPITTLTWSHSKQLPQCLLVCCEDGSMLEVEAPAKGQFDTSKTYHLEPLPCTARLFTSIKDRLRQEEEEARRAAERERKRKEREAIKQRKREELGDDYVSEEEEEEEEREGEGEGAEGEGGEGEQAVEEVEKPAGPSPILQAFYSREEEDKTFWVSMGGYDAGYLYCCSLDGAGGESEPYEATQSVPVPAFAGDDLPLHSLTFSASGEYLLAGASNGSVRVHPLASAYSLSSLQAYWALSMHDNHYGAVTQLATTYDDQYVLSGGADGNIFVYTASLPTAIEKRMTAAAALEKAPVSLDRESKDIEDPNHYSIEDAKQKAEHDRKMKLAEEKKQRVRREVASLRRTFRKLQQRSRELPAHLQLGTEEFVMDRELEARLQEEAKQKEELVHREMAWEGEKQELALHKLRNRYKDVVECERVTVWAFGSELHVSSFRAAAPSKEYLQLVEKVVSSELTQTPWTVAGKRPKQVRHAGGMREEEKKQSADTPAALQRPESLSKTEARRLHKEQRKKEWEELMQQQPSEQYEDPEEVAILQQFKGNMGDYKLKTAGDYVVPEHQRVSTDKKRRQLLLLRQQIFECKRQHNRKLLALRDRKIRVVEQISVLVDKLRLLQYQLPSSKHQQLPAVPQLRPEEVPERELQYSRESLLQFQREQAAREAAERQAAAGAGEGFGGFGGFGGGGEPKEGENQQTEDGAEQVAGEVPGKDDDGVEEGGSGPPSSSSQLEQLSPLHALKCQEQQVLLVYEWECLIQEVEQLQSSFDQALMMLRHEKAGIDASVITADLRHITQFEELQLLKEFEKKETTFTSRYRSKKKERQAMDAKIEEVQWSLGEKEREVARLQEQDRALNSTFLEAIGENNKFKDFLLKVFRKKIKRVKRKLERAGVEERGEESSEEESDSDYLSSSEDESESEEGGLDDSICPAGCDPVLFEQACTLREQRLDLEEQMTEEKRALDLLRRELESLKKKAKAVEAHVKTALSELQAFQLKKQQRLNELDQVSVLQLHQILYHGQGGMPPTSITPCLVFSASCLLQLTRRIGELTGEKQQEKKRYKDLRQKHVHLIHEKREIQNRVSELDAKAKEIMLLKFGRIVDLDRLEGLSVNRIVQELQERLKAMERKSSRELAALEAKRVAEKQRLLAVTRDNTHRLDNLTGLLAEQKQLEEQLNARQKAMSVDVGGGEGRSESQECWRLMELAQLQSREIHHLKEEIHLLSLKGGHILPPSQPPTSSQLPPLH